MRKALTPLRIEAAFWLILCAALVLGIGLETEWGAKTQWAVGDTKAGPTDFTRPALSEPFQLPAPDQFLSVTTRPMFIVTRRPAPPPPPPEAPKPAMKKGQFVLMGTTIVPEGKFAFLLEKANNKTRVVAQGKLINEILVKEVSADRVVLSQFDDTEVLSLLMNKAAGTPHPAPGAAPGGVRVPPPSPQMQMPTNQPAGGGR